MVEQWNELVENRVLLVTVLSWFIAQTIKAVIYLIINKKFLWERMVGSGGMPSSHAATVCSLATTVLLHYGVASFEFAISFIFMIIVLHDAHGVRFETGKQATILNQMVIHFSKDTKTEFPKLKELVGHTPLQVLIGGILGIIIALIFQ